MYLSQWVSAEVQNYNLVVFEETCLFTTELDLCRCSQLAFSFWDFCNWEYKNNNSGFVDIANYLCCTTEAWPMN